MFVRPDSVDQSRFDLEGSPLVHPVSMDHVSDLETGVLDLPDAPDLVVEVIAFESLCGMNVREGAPCARCRRRPSHPPHERGSSGRDTDGLPARA
jgi:hypothetical protein